MDLYKLNDWTVLVFGDEHQKISVSDPSLAEQYEAASAGSPGPLTGNVIVS